VHRRKPSTAGPDWRIFGSWIARPGPSDDTTHRKELGVDASSSHEARAARRGLGPRRGSSLGRVVTPDPEWPRLRSAATHTGRAVPVPPSTPMSPRSAL
jgi:hypothetical protein